MHKIEEFLRLTEEEILKRKQELLAKIPTRPGIGYLKARLKEFEVQPWPFLGHMAHYAPKELNGALDAYRDYDGNENAEVIMEKLRDEYIIATTSEYLMKEKEKSRPKVT